MSTTNVAQPPAPPAANVQANVLEAQTFAANNGPAETLLWFFSQVKNKGPWDYKQQGTHRQYEEFGNWHYSVIGTAIGLPEGLLLRAAGGAQILSSNWNSSYGTRLVGPPYGDDPDDKRSISQGIEWARVNVPARSFMFPADPIRIPGLWDAEGWFWGLDPEVQTLFDSALRFVVVRDPLVLDLDGDGLELTAATGQVLFDHNADGIRTGTGWVASDDGLLVLDRNGNGTIDSGRELFGVDTVKSNGNFAREGFDALRDLDANGDGVFNASDAAFAQVRVWRDLDQDGVSDAGELSTLAQRGISSISLSNTASGQVINGNRVDSVASFTRTAGGTSTVGAIDFAENLFAREFTQGTVTRTVKTDELVPWRAAIRAPHIAARPCA